MTGNELKERRKAMGMTQADLAEELGVNESTIKRAEARGDEPIERMMALAVESIERDGFHRVTIEAAIPIPVFVEIVKLAEKLEISETKSIFSYLIENNISNLRDVPGQLSLCRWLSTNRIKHNARELANEVFGTLPNPVHTHGFRVDFDKD